DAGLYDDEPGRARPAAPPLPVLPPAVDRMAERAAARFGLIEHAAPVFAPAARVPLAGLMLALPGLEASGLLSCARNVFGALPNGFYGLHTVLLEAVLRTLAGQARAEGATRIEPAAFGRVLGMDRAPEVKTIRRKLGLLAGTGRVGRLVAAMAATHLARPDATGADPGDPVGMVLYVDGHVRTYHGTRKIGKTHVARLKFPAPATVETWVGDAHGDPVLVVMAQPGACLAGELRRLVPDLRAAVGDERRVLVGFDRGGWSPALFKHLHAHGFDVLTSHKGATADIDPDLFTDLTFLDPDTGREHTWRAADTTVTLTLTKTKTKTASGGADHQDTDTPEEDQVGTDGDTKDTGTVFTMRQVTLAVPATKHTKKRAAADHAVDSTDDPGDSTEAEAGDSAEASASTEAGDAGSGGGLRQIHILTTRTDLPAEQIIHRMGSRWRQENGFRYGRMHFDLDSHDSYAATDDDPDRLVPNRPRNAPTSRSSPPGPGSSRRPRTPMPRCWPRGPPPRACRCC
ncbi:MAG: hypothetical protein L0H64_21390, partial [Pseudonocardia sp.]|nr:hypothetical protein [Pseudonocardia sp.]